MSAISPNTPSTRAPAPVLELLDGLRTRIRWYVILEGVSMLVVWLTIAFWIGLGLDYLPVMMGANEMPRSARVVVLTLTLIAAGWVLYHFLFRRVFRKFQNSSLALLVERHFPSFRDSLVTTVESNFDNERSVESADLEAIRLAGAGERSVLGSEMLARTIERAKDGVAIVKLGKVFSYRPLISKLLAAMASVSSLILLAFLGNETLATGASRLLLLSDQDWERRARIELVDFDATGVRKVAKGTDLILRVRADATRPYPPPELCSILYETMDGDRGRLNMSRDGEPTDGYQYYVFNGKPFKSILNDIQFDVIGSDHRLRDCRIRVVLSPVVTEVQLNSVLPDYTGLDPRVEKWSPGAQLPIGSQVTATVHSSKDLVSAEIKDIDSGERDIIEFPTGESHRQVVYEIPKLSGRAAITVSLKDRDGIESPEPFLVTIGAIEDEVPKVEMGLRGIGTSITANAKLVVEGEVKDDYEIDRNWFDVKIGDVTREFDFPTLREADSALGLDLRVEAETQQEQPLALKPQDRIVFSVRASDKYDLDGLSHVGSNEPTTLTVVRPDELLAILDGRELGLRRRLEQIKTEMLQSRDSLSRLRGSFGEDEGTAEAKKNLADLRQRWASWAAQKSDQSVLEVNGIAIAFEDIREELTNNRVDTPERKSRLGNEIITPLRAIADQQFPSYQDSLKQLRLLMTNTDKTAEEQSVQVLERLDEIIVAMDAVLDKMLELEDYAEIVNVVRQLIEQQEKLLEKTKEEQKANVLDFLK